MEEKERAEKDVIMEERDIDFFFNFLFRDRYGMY